MTGFAVQGTRKVRADTNASSSNALMAFKNSASAIPRKLRRELCLNAL